MLISNLLHNEQVRQARTILTHPQYKTSTALCYIYGVLFPQAPSISEKAPFL